LAYWFKDWDWEKSEHLFQLALKTEERLFGAESSEVADVWLSWAELKESRHQISNALEFLNKAEELYLKEGPEFTGRISFVKFQKALNLYWRRDFQQAQQLLQQSAELLDQAVVSNDDDFVRNQWSRYTLAVVERYLQNYKGAKSILTTLIVPSQKRPPLDLEYMVASFLELAVIARLQGNNAEASEWLARTSKELDQMPADMWGKRRAKFAHERGMLALANDDYKEAELQLRNAISLGTKDPNMDLIALADFMDDLSRVLHLRKRGKDASEMEKNAQQIRARFKN
jgi:tetratricopeptide (TPR) repeat protein